MKKLFRSILCMLLAVTALFAFASCGKDEELELKAPEIKGEAMSEADVSAWFTDYESKAEKASANLGWYEIRGKMYSESPKGETLIIGQVDISGVVYVSADEDEVKISIEMKETVTTKNNDEILRTEQTTIKQIHLDGVTYMEESIVIDGENEMVDYYKDESGFNSLFPEFAEVLTVEKILSYKDVVGTFYSSKDSLTIQTVKTGRSEISAYVFKNDSAVVDTLVRYYYASYPNIYGEQYKSEMILEHKKILTGSVKAPKDIEKYE